MPLRSTLCLVIDRLHAGFLGCYGNSWVETSEFDQLAAESFLLDHALADSPDLARRYFSYWQGASPLAPSQADAAPSLARLAGQAGFATCLVSDDPQVFDHPLAGDFAQVIPYRFPPRTASAADAADTNLAEFFAAAGETLRTLDSTSGDRPYFGWLHTQGMAHSWDAPLEMRREYLDNPDERPPEFVEVPSRVLPEDVDPDERLALRRAYAAQVALADACLGTFLDELRALPEERQPLLVVLSPRGFPLGEHRAVGAAGTALHEELVHVPWMFRFPAALAASVRSQSLALPADLPATLLDWWGVTEQEKQAGTGLSLMPVVRGDTFALRDRAVLASDSGERALRTPAWHLRRAKTSDEDLTGARERFELYVKPDDRWEVNEVANRCREIAERLSAAIDASEQAIVTGQPVGELAPLDHELVEY